MRPFGKTDIDFITSGRFAMLENATKAVYHVITGLVSFRTGQFFHSAGYIADLAGYSTRTAERALAELLEEHVISIVLQRPGETTVYQYNFVADGADRGGYSTIDPRPIPNAAEPPPLLTREIPLPIQLHPEPPTRMSQPPDTGGGGLPTRVADKQELFNEIETTTAADRISESLIAKMRAKYGNETVDAVVFSMKSMNGEVKNADAYFATAIRQGFIPTSKKVRDAQSEQARQRREEKRREREQAERKKLLQEDQERLELAAIFEALQDDQKNDVLQQATKNAKSIEGITAEMTGFDMCVLTEQYKILKTLRVER